MSQVEAIIYSPKADLANLQTIKLSNYTFTISNEKLRCLTFLGHRIPHWISTLFQF